MVLYALEQDRLIFAPDARPDRSYACLECRGSLRVRYGRRRKTHFYHLQTTPTCRLYSKNERHRIIQLHLEHLLPLGAAQVEKPFLSICRVADLYWADAKIAFEIQCSPMSDEEAHARIRDYGALGIEVVWLLDDRMYNKKFLRACEQRLRSHHPAYFIHMPKEGLTPYFYDQWEFLLGRRRIFRKGRFPIELNRPIAIVDGSIKKKFYFPGDVCDRQLHSEAYPWDKPHIEAILFLKRQYPQDEVFRELHPLLRCLLSWYWRGLDLFKALFLYELS